MKKIEELMDNLDIPFEAENGIMDHIQNYIYLKPYFDPIKNDSNRFKIYYHKTPDEQIREKLIHHVFTLLNEVKIIPKFVNFLIPDNQVIKTYSEFQLYFNKHDSIDLKNGVYKFKVVLPTKSYITYYKNRYYKVPLLHTESLNHDIHLCYSWVTSIIL